MSSEAQQAFTTALLAVMADAGKLGHRVAKECFDQRMPHPEHLWVFTLLARISTCSVAVGILIKQRYVHDARLLARAAAEGAWDICYVLHGPIRGRALGELLTLEQIEDEHDLLSYEAARRSMSIPRLAAREPWARKVVDQFKKATNHMKWGNRWRHITTRDKLAVFDQFMPTFALLLDYPLRTLGNAVAHARPSVLGHYAARRRSQALRVDVKPMPGSLYSPYVVTSTTLVCLMVAIDMVVDSFYLAETFGDSLRALVDRWKEIVNTWKSAGGTA